MKACPFSLQGNPVPRAREFLNRADTTIIQPRSKNAQVSADRAAKFLHAESFASGGSDSLNPIKSFPDAVSGPLTQPQGQNPKMGHCLTTITGKNYLTLLRPSFREYRHVVHRNGKNGRPSVGPGQQLPLVGICLLNEKEHGMSQHTPSQFLLSG